MQVPLEVPANARLAAAFRRAHHTKRAPGRDRIVINARWRAADRPGGFERNHSLDFGSWAPRDQADEAAWRVVDMLAQAAVKIARLDLRTRAITALPTFAALVAAPYTPTLSDPRLADAYDAAQLLRGVDRKASRR